MTENQQNTNWTDWPFFTDDHRSLRNNILSWSKQNVPELTETEDEYDAARMIVNSLGEAGWLKYVASDENGDDKHDVRSLCICRETLAYTSGLADFSFAMQGLGSGPIVLFGSEDQKKDYLPGVRAGKNIAAFAITEAKSGSDVSSIQTELRKEEETYVLSGTKTWISNAGIADFYVVFARNDESMEKEGITAVLLDSDTDGFEVTEQLETTSPHPLGSLKFNDCRVPPGKILGTPGEGMKVALATLDVFRATVGAAAVGFARRALDEATEHSNNREVFDRKLFDFQMTQQKIADMSTEIDAAALLVYRAAWQHDTRPGRVTEEASKAKLYATEKAQEIIDEAVQLHGGKGVLSGTRVEELYRSIRPLRIYEGASEIQKVIIAREIRKELDSS